MDKEVRSRIMSQIKSKGTSPEIAVQKALWIKGVRYRVQYGKEKIDIAFPNQKLAVFIDGCFWHSCPIHGHVPKSNIAYWEQKLKKNEERAKAKDIRLNLEEWEVMHFWEHEAKANPAMCAKKIYAKLKWLKKNYRQF